MKTLTSLLFILFLSFIHVLAQETDAWTLEKKPVLFEKLYLHIDRELYAPGDMIWFKAYQVNGITNRLNSNYRNLFVQLVNENGIAVKDVMLFSINGQAQGGINTDSLKNGMYTIRAFTKYLTNFGEEALFHKKIIINDTRQPINSLQMDTIESTTVGVDFLPESGNIILNAFNTVAFKATDQKGKGIPVSGKIINDLGDSITSFKSIYKGMGKFTFMPVNERSYYALIDQNPKLKIKLNNIIAEGVNLSSKDMGQSLCFTLSTNSKLDQYYSFYLVVSHKGTTLTREVEMEAYTQTLCLGKELFPEGISKVTVLDALKNPVAERLIYVAKEESKLMELQLSKQEYEPREKVTLNVNSLLSENDSITSALSLNVVNEAYFGADGNSQNIKSYLLLDAELKGNIEAPASYFTDDKIPSSEKLDLLMMVNGWRSYFWDDVITVDTASVEDWNNAGIEIKGYVKKLLWKAPLPDTELTLASRGGSFIIEKTKSIEMGRFSFQKVYLSNVTKITINALTEKGSHNAEIKLDKELKTDTVIRVGSMENTCFNVDFNTEYDRINSFRRTKIRAFELEQGSILLKDVDIVKKRKFMGDGHFRIYSFPDNSLTISEEDYSYSDILNYLEGRIGGVVVSGDQVSIRGGAQPLFLIDGIEVTGFGNPNEIINQIKHIPMMEIDKIEILKSGANLALFGARGGNGVIAIYRKTWDERRNAHTYVKGSLETTIKGFHKAPKFYSPSYTPENINDPQPDYRPTLLWEPELSIKDGKANIEFYTSDELAHYLVFVEGITKNGKICYGTASFWVDKK